MKKILPMIVIVLVVSLVSGCGGPAAEKKAGTSGKKIVIYATFYPTCEFSGIIGGDYVKVVNPLPEDADPVFWMPSREIIREYQEKADLIVINGAGFEKWVKKVMLPEDKIVNTAKPFEDNLIEIKGTITHSHGSEGSHTHAGIDGHTWMDPVLAKKQAEVIMKALIRKDPAHKKEYNNNYGKLCGKLDKLDNMFRELAGKYNGRMLAASHPAYNYIARRYGWKMKSFDFDPEKMPTGHSMGHFRDFVKKHKIRHLVWESYPGGEVEKYFLEKSGVRSIEFSPVEALSGEDSRNGRDYFSIMEQNIRNISVLFSKE